MVAMSGGLKLKVECSTKTPWFEATHCWTRSRIWAAWPSWKQALSTTTWASRTGRSVDDLGHVQVVHVTHLGQHKDVSAHVVNLQPLRGGLEEDVDGLP